MQVQIRILISEGSRPSKGLQIIVENAGLYFFFRVWDLLLGFLYSRHVAGTDSIDVDCLMRTGCGDEDGAPRCTNTRSARTVALEVLGELYCPIQTAPFLTRRLSRQNVWYAMLPRSSSIQLIDF